MNENENNTHEAPPAPQESNFDAAEAVEKVKQTADKIQNIKGWSWGAFMLAPVLIIGTKKYKYLLAYLLALIPLLGHLALLGFHIYLGLNAKILLEGNKMFSNEDEKVGFIKGINHAGFVLFIISAVMFLLGFLFFGAMIAAMFSFVGSGPEINPYYYR